MFQQMFLEKIGLKEASVKITTRECDANSKKIPDVTVSGADILRFVEVKERAPLYPKQWDNYRAIASERGYDPDKSVFAIVAPWANVDDRIQPRANIFRWTEIYAIARDASSKEADEVARFLLYEFMDFLEARSMKPFDGFSESDINVINNIPEAGKKLKDFLQEILNRIGALPNSAVTVQPRPVEVKTYKEYPEIYVWASFLVKSKSARSKALNVWFGVSEYQTSGPSLALGVWTTNHMWTSKTERIKWQKKLRGLGFVWDEESEGGFVKPLKSGLKSTEKEPELLENVVLEIQQVTGKIYSRL